MMIEPEELDSLFTMANNVYRELDGSILLGAYRIEYVPHCLVLRPVVGGIVPWLQDQEVMVGWDPEDARHTNNTVVISIYLSELGIEGDSDAYTQKFEVQLTSDEMGSATRLVMCLMEFLFDAGRLASRSDFLEAVCPKGRD